MPEQGGGGIDNCEWKTYTGGYNESCGGRGGDIGCEPVGAQGLAALKAKCCSLGAECASMSVPAGQADSAGAKKGLACLKKNDGCGWKANPAYESVVKVKQGPPQPPPKGATITATLASVGWSGASSPGSAQAGARVADGALGVAAGGTANVRDLWAQKDLGSQSSLSAVVAPHGLALLRLSK